MSDTRQPQTASPGNAIAQAIALLGTGSAAQAAELLAGLRSRFPEDADVLHLSGAAARRLGRLDEALAWLRQSVAIRPGQPAVLNNLGGTLLQAGHVDEAVATLRETVRLAPGLQQAHFNLGLALTRAEQFDEAVTALTTAIRLAPPNAPTLEALGIAQTRAGQPETALATLDRALALEPQRVSLLHNKAVANEAAGNPGEAIALLERAARLAPNMAGTTFALANLLRNQSRFPESVDWFRRTIALDPGNLLAHRLLNETIWQADIRDRQTPSYADALRVRPADVPLRLAFANHLLRTQNNEAAVHEFRQAGRLQPDAPEVLDGLARALAACGNTAEAIETAARAARLAPDNVEIAGNHGELLLRGGHATPAIDVLRATLAREPFNQENIARLGVAYRLAGDISAHHGIADPATLAVTARLDPPEGFSTIEAFNNALAVRLRSLHTARQHPTDQTLRGGTQTLGSLFALEEPLIILLREQLEKAIARTIDAMQAVDGHPFLSRKSRQFGFAGSWSVRLQKDGFHTNHIHPRGWMSSAYYINLPEEVDSEDRQGWFKIGEPNPDTLPHLPVERWVRPESGLLVLFPSYLWHGTHPFRQGSERLTVAFDVVPAA